MQDRPGAEVVVVFVVVVLGKKRMNEDVFGRLRENKFDVQGSLRNVSASSDRAKAGRRRPTVIT